MIAERASGEAATWPCSINAPNQLSLGSSRSWRPVHKGREEIPSTNVFVAGAMSSKAAAEAAMRMLATGRRASTNFNAVPNDALRRLPIIATA